MRSAATFRAVTKLPRTGLPALALYCAAILSFLTLASCGGDSCLIVTWNFAGSISTGSNSCKINTAMGTVTVRVVSTPPSTAGPMAPNLQHVFVTLRGIEAHPEALAGENSPGWEELAPNLASEPVQIDLMAPPAQTCTANSLSHTLVAAGVYKQMRLRLVPDQTAADAAVLQKNACGDVGIHCVVTTTGRISPLVLDGAAADLHIAPQSIASGAFRVLPDTDTDLAVEFNPFASLAVPSGESVRIVPVFSVDSVAPCDSLQVSQP